MKKKLIKEPTQTQIEYKMTDSVDIDSYNGDTEHDMLVGFYFYANA